MVCAPALTLPGSHLHFSPPSSFPNDVLRENSFKQQCAMFVTHVVSLLAGALLLAPAVGSVKKANILFLMCDSMDGRVLDPTSPGSDE